MHYSVLVITKSIPSDEDIANIMKKYNWNNLEYSEDGETLLSERPIFTYDWYQIGGRYNGKLKLKIDMENEEYRWQYYDRSGRNGRLFHSYLLRKMKDFSGGGFRYTEEDYYSSMGANEEFLYVDGARIKDLLNFSEVSCYACIDVDGNAIAVESWDGSNFIKDEQFDEKLKTIKENSKEYFATILDIHD
jgi:hypothetical protein